MVKFLLGCALAAGILPAQAPRIGAVEFYGFHKVSQEKAVRVLRLNVGDPLPPSKGDLEDRLEEISGIVEARVEAVCCEQGKAVLFIGVEEKGAQHFAFRSPPAGEAVLPEDIADRYQRFLTAVEAAARRGSAAEDLTRGHSLMADPDARELQQGFAAYAADNLPLLRNVLRDAADESQRAMAATIAGYAPDKTTVLDDLQYAMQDPDESVRASAMRSLSAIAVLGTRIPSLGIRIPATWFVEMLNSIVLSDRTRATAALVNLSEKNPAALSQIRDRALESVIEMARWSNLRYALPAFILAGRMTGLTEQQIEDAWTAGRREEVIERLQKPKAGK